MPIIPAILAIFSILSSFIVVVSIAGLFFVAGFQRANTAPKPSAISTNYHSAGGTILGANCGIPSNILPLINRASKVHKIDAAIIAGIIKQESNFNPSAVSPVGAAGLMQVMPDTYNWLLTLESNGNSGSLNNYKSLFAEEISNNPEFLQDKLDQRFNPGVSIYLGTFYVSYLFGDTATNGKLELVVAAYNGGQGAVEYYGGIPPYKETIDYVQKVTQNIDEYKDCLDDSSSSSAEKLRKWVQDNQQRSCQFTTDVTTPGGSACYRTARGVLDVVFPSNVDEGNLYSRSSHNPNQQDIDTMKRLLSEDKIPVLQIRGDASGQHWIAITGVRGSSVENTTIEFYDPATGRMETRAFNSDSRSGHGGYYFGINTTQSTDINLRGIVINPNQ